MISFLQVECAACEAVYTLSTEELNVLVLFQCLGCGQHNVYVSGYVLALDNDIMEHGTEIERKRHIIESLQLWACNYAGNVLRNVNKVIDVNVNAKLRRSDYRNHNFLEKGREESNEISGPRHHPSIVWLDAPQITDDEVRDFINIDLKLIDRKCYFNKFFGRRNA